MLRRKISLTEDPLLKFNRYASLQDELQLLDSSDFQVEHYLFFRQSMLSDLPSTQLPVSMRYRRNVPLLTYFQELNEHIHDFMEYKAQVTTINTTAKDILSCPQGVCQDYTHLMLDVLCSQQIPARYVSGYLNQGKDFTGAARMHAWVEACVPGPGWLGLDPTNRRLVDHHYIKVAVGLDYEDYSPLRGHIKPAGINCTDHNVQVVEQ
ncbi:MAG: transglutaminase-like domain-containing protein [Cyclobacteriaceae bacterium]